MDSYQIGDRRPLASRGWKISERIARWLARRGITPNAISIAGMLCGIAAGIMFFETSRVSHPWIFWLSGAVLCRRIGSVAWFRCHHLRDLSRIFAGRGKSRRRAPGILRADGEATAYGHGHSCRHCLCRCPRRDGLAGSNVRTLANHCRLHRYRYSPVTTDQRDATTSLRWIRSHARDSSDFGTRSIRQ